MQSNKDQVSQNKETKKERKKERKIFINFERKKTRKNLELWALDYRYQFELMILAD